MNMTRGVKKRTVRFPYAFLNDLTNQGDAFSGDRGDGHEAVGFAAETYLNGNTNPRNVSFS